MPRAGVLGWPVAHSRSPVMHEAAYAALGLDGWSYQRLPVPPELFAETVGGLPASGFAGANVTIPHKESALALADVASVAAREIGAANSLTFAAGGGIEADNTDAPGFLAALPWSPAGRTALVLGAGGSARAVVWALGRAGAAGLRVWNRTADRAERICGELGGEPVVRADDADLLINCTAAGLADPACTFAELPLTQRDLRRFGCVVDLVYRGDGRPTALLVAAADAGVETVDGLEILVQQGALSFSAWTGRAAPVDVMRAAAGT